MKLAAIDIGSNAIRFQVIRVIRTNDTLSFKKLEYIRFPLRLGADVFKNGAISKNTQRRFEKLMHTFQLLLDLYEVDGFVGVATSAMREAANAEEIIGTINQRYGLQIKTISGYDEAEILSKAIAPFLGDGTYMHIDVGGGSTELNVYHEKIRLNSQSFQMGTVRRLEGGDKNHVFREVETWMEEKVPYRDQTPLIAVGTGGNIRKLFQLSILPRSGSITLSELTALKAYVEAFSMEDRLNLLKLNPDRADVIIPAAEIYIEVMKRAKSDRILVPNVGLKDGLLYQLYEQVSGESIHKI
ncbi:MAG: phosphatase, partial [Haliscomenobacter sp.]